MTDFFKGKLIDLLPRMYARMGEKRIHACTADPGNAAGNTCVALGAWLGTTNKTYTAEVITGGGPPNCIVRVTDDTGDDCETKNILLLGIAVSFGALNLRLKFGATGGSLIEGNKWTVKCSAGDLQDFLEIAATGLDDIKDFIDAFPALVDVWRVPQKLLPYLGKILDYDYDYTRDPEAQRREIANLVDAYRMRGTIPGILRKLRLAGFADATVTEPYTQTIQFGVEGRGVAQGARLSDSKYCHGTFEVTTHELCRALWEILWDEVPRGVEMFSVQHETAGVTGGMTAGSVFAPESVFTAGTEEYPFKLFEAFSIFAPRPVED